MAFVVLGLCSNRPWQGKTCITLLQEACEALSAILTGMCISSVYTTKPMYVEHQSDFYNMAVCGTVSDELTPAALLSKIHCIEAALGRDRSRELRNGPRSIDIDIELFGSARVCEPDLEIPHPRLTERAFVLVPMFEVLKKTGENGGRIGMELYSELCKAAESVSTSGVTLYGSL